MREAVRKGMSLHLAHVARRRAAGDQRLGWKIGFKTAEIQAKLGLDGLTATALLASSVVDDGRPHSLSGTTKVGLEAEVGVVLSQEIRADMSDDAILAAIGEILPVVEIIDLDRPLTYVGPILAEGVFHRGLRLGETLSEATIADLTGMRAKMWLNGVCEQELDAAQATGDVAAILRQAAAFLAKYGKRERLMPADLVILGAMGSLVFPRDSDVFRFELGRSDHNPVAVEVRCIGHNDEVADEQAHAARTAEAALKPSREAQREVAQAIGDLALTLAQGKPQILRTPPFEPELIREIEQARAFKKDARSRQIRRLAQLLWHADRDAILQTLDDKSPANSERKARERSYEAWRQRLIDEGDGALQAWLDLYPKSDRNKVRRLLRQAQRELSEAKARTCQTELLRCLREIGEEAFANKTQNTPE